MLGRHTNPNAGRERCRGDLQEPSSVGRSRRCHPRGAILAETEKSTRRHAALRAGPRARLAFSDRALWQVCEWIEDLESRPLEVSIVSGGDGQLVSTSRRCDVAVLDWHTLTSVIQQAFLLGPHMRDQYVEPVDATVKRIDKTREPCLKLLPLPAFLRPDPVGQLCDDDGARVAAILLGLEPSDDLGNAVLLRRLADDVGIEQPAHNFRRLAGARRREGTSSGLVGHSFMTVNQFSRPPSRRKTRASSSGSKWASK